MKFDNFKVILLLLFLSILFYHNSLFNGYGLDDKLIFDHLQQIVSGNSLTDCFKVFTSRFDNVDYRPIPMFTFAIQQYITGSISPTLSHFINVALYFLIICTIYYTVRSFPINHSSTIAVVCAILFLVHPIHTNVVNNLKSRDSLLSMLFLMCALLFLTRFMAEKRIVNLFLLAFSFLLALYSKLDAVGLIFIIPLVLFFIYDIKWYKILATFILLTLFVSYLRFSMIDYLIPVDISFQHKNILFTENPIIASPSISNKISQLLVVYYTYLKFVLLPSEKYYFYYGYNMIPLYNLYSIQNIIYFIVLIIPIILSVWFYNRTKLVLLGTLIFYSTLLYCSNLFVVVQGILADRYAFIASFGFILSISAIIVATINYSIPKLKINIKSNWVFAVLLSFLGLISFFNVYKRNNDWKDMLTLIEADMPFLKNSFEANRIAATSYIKRALTTATSKAEKEYYFKKALDYALQANVVYDKDIYMRETKGMAMYGNNQISDAKKQFLQIVASNDSSVVSWDLLGDIYFSENKIDSAAFCYQKVYDYEKENEGIYYKLPVALYKSDKQEKSIEWLKNLINEKPNWFVPYESLGYIYLYEVKDKKTGIYYLVKAFQLGKRDDMIFRKLSMLLNEEISKAQDPDKSYYIDLQKQLGAQLP